MSIWRQFIEVARSIPSEFELWIHRKIMASHRPDPDMVRDGVVYSKRVESEREVTWSMICSRNETDQAWR